MGKIKSPIRRKTALISRKWIDKNTHNISNINGEEQAKLGKKIETSDDERNP